MRGLVDVVGRLERPEGAPVAPPSDARLEAMAARIEDLTLAVDEGIKNVQRSERRVRSVVQSARRELQEAGFESPGVEAEATELREVHGDGGDDGKLRAVPTDVEDDSQIPSGIPGVSLRQMRTARRRHQ